eukprot:IDg6674t1
MGKMLNFMLDKKGTWMDFSEKRGMENVSESSITICLGFSVSNDKNSTFTLRVLVRFERNSCILE